MKLDFEKMGGLIPVIVQNIATKEVLMLGYMNKEAYKKTLETGFVTFWSRSKNRLWKKGKISGNFLKVCSISEDCDGDALLIRAEPSGPTCHEGTGSCFGEKDFGLFELFELIETRKKEMPAGSYTTSLFHQGLTKILAKVEEESEEVIRAAKSEGKQRLIEESCDLLYHLFVLLVNEKITLRDLEKELKRRQN